MARTEEEKIGGYLTVQYGGVAVSLPTLKIVDSRAWKQAFAKAFTGDTLMSLRPGKVDLPGFMDADAIGSKAMLDLVVAYDKTNALGGRKEIERTLDDDQVMALYERLVEVTFRFASGITATQLAMMTVLTSQRPPDVPLNGASSPSSPSQSGDSGLTVSPPN